MDVARFVERLRRAPANAGEAVHVEAVAAREARHGALRHELAPALVDALGERGLLPLYAHQAAAIDAVMDGRDVAVVTPTASGKSLCYHVPVVDALCRDPSSRALYVFPTKALAQDQLRSLRGLLGAQASRAAIFDGDTPRDERASLRRAAHVVLTNPDMLHVGLLPNHRAWARFLGALRYVVIDEAHVYRGVFGSHVANVVRRLRRLCAHYGSDPVFILCSATIANPGELAERLIAKPVDVIAEDGAPRAGRWFVFWNPPVVDQERNRRASAGSEASRLLETLLKAEARTLAFVRTRKQAELVYVSVRDRLSEGSPQLARRIRPYRATYLAEDRRAVERGLSSGELLGVVTTNALELGIDIGDLDATLLAGYPGSVASTWQQAGRSGRNPDGGGGHESLSVLIAQDNPLDQYLMRHPGFFFGHPHEHARIRPENPHILQPHLQCAAYELPLLQADAALFGDDLALHVEAMASAGLLHERGGRWYPTLQVSYPAQQVNIRSASSSEFLALEAESGRVLEHVDESDAFNQLHAGAVYLHQGESFVVERLDVGAQAAYLRRADVGYYTESRELTDVRVVREHASVRRGDVRVCLGDVEVSRQVVGFRRKGLYKDEELGDEPLDLPSQVFQTVAVWFDVSRTAMRWVRGERADLAGGLHALEHAAIGVLPLFALCDRNDIGGVSTPLHPDTGAPQVFIYDGHPGGVGIAEHGFAVIDDLWSATLATVSECPCADGCPACIQSPKCGNNNQPLDKAVAVRLLRDLLGK